MPSLVGTTVEFFDFYIYATAAVLVFPKLFFPASDAGAAALASLATFGIAFLARPVGSVVFGHFGDRVGRKTTLVIALSTMGLSTVLIGALPTYASIGFVAPLLLALCRFGQGLGLGGEWGGAVLLATENAPPGKRALVRDVSAAWRADRVLSVGRDLSSAVACPDGRAVLRVRMEAAVSIERSAGVPWAVCSADDYGDAGVPGVGAAAGAGRRADGRDYAASTWARLVAAVLVCFATFVLFYLMTVFALSWGTTALGYHRETFLLIQLFGIVFFAVTIPISALLAERGRRR